MIRRRSVAPLHAVVFAGTIVLAAATAGCGDTPTTPSTAPFTHNDVLVGTGDEAVAGKTLTVNYTGWLFDRTKPDLKGLQFDSSLGRAPFSFVLGAGQVIEGWDRGLIGMKAGGTRRLVVPPSLAYGAIRNASIPPYSTIVFDVELLSVE